jgi:hypothetical protein
VQPPTRNHGFPERGPIAAQARFVPGAAEPFELDRGCADQHHDGPTHVIGAASPFVRFFAARHRRLQQTTEEEATTQRNDLISIIIERTG